MANAFKDRGKVLDADDVARATLFAYQQPEHVCIREIVFAATHQDAISHKPETVNKEHTHGLYFL